LWHLRFLQRYWHKTWNKVSIWYTKGKVERICTTKLVQGEKHNDCWICIVTLNLVPWKMLTTSTQKTMSFGVISFWLKLPSSNKNSIMQDVILSILNPSTTCTIDHNNGVHIQLLTTYTCINNQWWLWMDVSSSHLIDKYWTPITLTFNTFKIWAWICSPIS